VVDRALTSAVVGNVGGISALVGAALFVSLTRVDGPVWTLSERRSPKPSFHIAYSCIDNL
jgi:hypothetical protein